MFSSIGGTELIVIGVVALVVVGPKDLPDLFRTVGKFTAKARSMAREFSRAMEAAADQSGVKDISKTINAAARPAAFTSEKVRELAGLKTPAKPAAATSAGAATAKPAEKAEPATGEDAKAGNGVAEAAPAAAGAAKAPAPGSAAFSGNAMATPKKPAPAKAEPKKTEQKKAAPKKAPAKKAAPKRAAKASDKAAPGSETARLAAERKEQHEKITAALQKAGEKKLARERAAAVKAAEAAHEPEPDAPEDER